VPRTIPSGGASRDDCRVFILGERPGFEEYRAWQNFVGPAGAELWSTLRRYSRLERSSCFVANLVRTFSSAPPSPREIARDWPLLLADLYKIRPSVILTVGAHAARALLPQFADVNQDVFHGLLYEFTYGRVHPRTALVLPMVHSSAALRQPDRYANALADDARMLRRVLDADDPRTLLHRPHRPAVYQVGLAGFGRSGQILGLDTEGSVADPECVTLALNQKEAACCETLDGVRPKFLKPAIESAAVVAIHHAKYDWAVLATLGIDLAHTRVDDSMIMAHLLSLPQGLKTLAYRVLGYTMSDYEDLVIPLDDARVTGVLESHYGQVLPLLEETRRRAAARQKADRAGKGRSRGGPREGRPDGPRPAQGAKSAKAPLEVQLGTAVWTPRALASLAKIVRTSAEKSRRDRWESSKFAPLILLPPAPTWRDAPPAERTQYAMTDAVAHLHVRNTLRPMIKAQGLAQVYAIDRGVLPFLVRNEQIGLACDGDELVRLSAQFSREYDRTLAKIETLAGHPVNPNAHEEVSQTLFEELGITPTRPTKSRSHYTTEDKYLKARKHEHAIVPLIIEARQIDKLRGTYTARLPSLLREGRYHPNWKYTRTASGRPAEEIILLVPKHATHRERAEKLVPRATMVRNAFHATDGHTLVSCDLSQIELRVCAHVSRDPVMLKVYDRGEDLHAKTAHDLLGAPKRKEDQDDSLHRLPAKTINFQILMGTTEYGLLDKFLEEGLVGWDIERCRNFIDEWYKLYAGVDVFVKNKIAEARRHGYVTDMWGRRRWLAAIHSTSDRVRREAERQAQSFAFQAGAIGIAKLWIKRVYRHVLAPRIAEGRRYCEPYVWVHDDVTVEADERIQKTVAREMLALVPDVLCIPTKADAKSGVRWGDLH
jgi:uracil-DNA glycosylase family 4